MVKVLRVTLLAVLLLPTLALAQVTLGLRVGYAIPGGDLQKDSPLADRIASQVPLQLDVNYRLTPGVSAGIYVGYGFAQIAGATKDQVAFLLGPGATYSASTLRAGLQASYAYPFGAIVPWAGISSGFESAGFELKSSDGAKTMTGAARGWEYFNLQGGADYKFTPAFGAGLYVSWGMGAYRYMSTVIKTGTLADSVSASGGLGDQAASHNWFTFGVRGTYDL
jgi:hypothetical protein